jgi:K+/H+ antiporter YhaU regulatory subunit KhtT
MSKLKGDYMVSVELSEREINNVIDIINYMGDYPEEFSMFATAEEYLEIKRKLNTAMTLDHIKEIDAGRL